jgi:hypothetical protein
MPREGSILLSLSNNARWILAGLSLALVLLLFPPFWYAPGHGADKRQWHFFLDSGWTSFSGERELEGAVDLPMLLLEFLVGGVGVGAAWYLSTSLRGQHRVPNGREKETENIFRLNP